MVLVELLPGFAQYGYLGLFFATMFSSMTIILPLPIFGAVPALFKLGLNPFWIGIAAGLGTAVGESTGYLVGVGGRKIVLKKYPHRIEQMEHLFSKYKPFVAILILGVLPFPFDVLGMFCGIIRYDFKKFFGATVIAKIIRFWMLAYSGPLLVDIIYPKFGSFGVIGALIFIAILLFSAWRFLERQ